MIPPRLASAAFRLFMQIPRSRIERDLAQGPDGYNAALDVTRRFYATDEEDMTAELCAEHMHAGLVAGSLGKAHPLVDRDSAFWLTGTAMHTVAEAAVFAAETTGELGQLTRDLDRIRDESGIEEYDELPSAEQSEEYRIKVERAVELRHRIEKMIAVDTLRRYGLDEEAELFEADGPAFSERMSRGYQKLSEKGGKP